MHIAIVGCGQLARMMALAGWPMGYRFTFLAGAGENTTCVKGLGDIVDLTDDMTGNVLFSALGEPDVVTVEREHVDTALLKTLVRHCAVYPQPEAIEVCQHRGREKTFLNNLGIPTANFRVANSNEELQAAIDEMGTPVLIKSCEEGYDGRGQWLIENPQQLTDLLNSDTVLPEVVVEGFVKFEREVSLVAARSPNGDISCYPLAENHHSGGILLSSIAPAPALTDEMTAQAKEIADAIFNKLNYVGVLAIELFVSDGKLIVNELAPRVHNSGHWTQIAGICTQFENHMRAITSVGLGTTEPTGHSAMVNLLGCDPTPEMVDMSNVQLHKYNKSLRPNRKVGHLNLRHNSLEELQQQVEKLKQELYG